MTRLVMTLLLAAGVLFIAACGGGGFASNEYLGDLPGMAQSYYEDLESLDEKLENTTSMEKAFKYDKEMDQMEDEADEKLEAYAEEHSFEPLPYEIIGNTGYTVKEVRVVGAEYCKLELEMDIEFAEEPKSKYGGKVYEFYTYGACYDKEGNLLNGRIVFSGSNTEDNPFKPGTVVTLKGSQYNLNELVDFANLKLMAKDEYDKLASK